ncbi:SDR family oxidoreductase [Pseudomonas antarctica]|uniref:SDR family oxidoreductase n=1 Tax=Pseudomonas antarctica TaxID=219572 RepID=UPI003F756876
MKISNNTIFIPGATSGIGLALALRLKACGNTIIVGGRRTEVLEKLSTEHGFATVHIDVADSHSIQSATAQVIADHPKLNVLLAMAGIMVPENWHEAESFLQVAEDTVNTNLLGPIRLIAACMQQLKSQPNAAIVTVSSGLASVPLAHTPTYCATKAAIHMLSEAIRLQLADTSVQVIELVPPAVQTSLMDNDKNPRAMPLEAFADAVIDLLEQQPDAHEILVEQVKFQRFAERRGEYDKVLAVINSNR